MGTAPSSTQVSAPSWTRWLAISVFVLSSSLNYLDRLLLAALAPTIKAEFHLSNAEYGQVIAVFSIVYAAMAPAAGWFIDRVGLNRGITLAMGVWSLAGAATGFTSTLRGLIACRTVLGIGEAAGIPGTGKANGLYLASRELALGTALNQVGITIGSVAAPLMVAALAPVYGWRYTFVIAGVLGFLWLPLWWFVSRRVPANPQAKRVQSVSVNDILSDPRMWGLITANALVMTLYTLWTNWTTVYLVQERNMGEATANRELAWIPPVFATLGGFVGGWLAYRNIQSGREVFQARMRVCWISAVLLLATALVPFMPTPTLAVAGISLSFFWCLAISTNLYAMPIDWYGAGRAAFGVSVITSSFGFMSALVSPLIGTIVDQFGFAPVCFGFSILPLLGITILRATNR